MESLTHAGVLLRSLREGIDYATPTVLDQLTANAGLSADDGEAGNARS